MATIRVDIQVPTFCECGYELTQVGKVGYDITVKACPQCREEAKTEGYQKGYEDGREEEEPKVE